MFLSAVVVARDVTQEYFLFLDCLPEPSSITRDGSSSSLLRLPFWFFFLFESFFLDLDLFLGPGTGITSTLGVEDILVPVDSVRDVSAGTGGMAVTEIPCGTRNIAEEDVELELILVTAEAEVREAMAAALAAAIIGAVVVQIGRVLDEVVAAEVELM
ncbi:ORF171 [White spot syndrome virus]|nr:ORF171 [White spot syndrome virus]